MPPQNRANRLVERLSSDAPVTRTTDLDNSKIKAALLADAKVITKAGEELRTQSKEVKDTVTIQHLSLMEGAASEKRAAEARQVNTSIKDADMAVEMVNFTRMQIAQLQGTAVMAQGIKSSPQGALALLR
jgi:hypothetical protein